jgi:thiosulfate dehydrogenase [quinone] large subunit
MTMSVIQPHRHEATATEAQVGVPVTDDHDRGPWFDRALATLRIAFGITFLWAFLDKTFALGFHTGYDQEGNLDRFGDAAWINGGSPTDVFLAFGVNPDSPFADFFNGLAGYAVIDWLFMLGLLAIGTTLTLGIGMRFAAVAGAALYLMMYAAVMVPENNPVFDDHLIGAITVVVLALTLAGDTWGAGKAWAKTHLVRRYGFLR